MKSSSLIALKMHSRPPPPLGDPPVLLFLPCLAPLLLNNDAGGEARKKWDPFYTNGVFQVGLREKFASMDL